MKKLLVLFVVLIVIAGATLISLISEDSSDVDVDINKTTKQNNRSNGKSEPSASIQRRNRTANSELRQFIRPQS